jgi:hypothetical protein
MRYFGTFSGRLINETKQKVYQCGEEPEYWDSFFAELINVTDELGNVYGRVFVKATQKTALRIKNYIIPNNSISFDCKEIREGVVVGIRNVCSTFLRIRFGDSCEIVNFLEYSHRTGRSLGCIDCKYRNKKSDCLKNCILERK